MSKGVGNTELVRTSASLATSVVGIIGLHYRQFVNPALFCINFYASVDLFFVERDMGLHHLLVILFSTTTPQLLQKQIMNDFLKLEYSNLFLSSRPLLIHYLSSKSKSHPNIVRWIPTINTMFHIAFAGTFVKYRIYEFGMNVILNEDVYLHVYYQGIVHYLYCIMVLWIFYALNFYWFQLILLRIKN